MLKGVHIETLMDEPLGMWSRLGGLVSIYTDGQGIYLDVSMHYVFLTLMWFGWEWGLVVHPECKWRPVEMWLCKC